MTACDISILNKIKIASDCQNCDSLSNWLKKIIWKVLYMFYFFLPFIDHSEYYTELMIGVGWGKQEKLGTYLSLQTKALADGQRHIHQLSCAFDQM